MENETENNEETQTTTQAPDPIAAALEKIKTLEAAVEVLKNAPKSGVEITAAESTNIKNMLEAGNYAYAIKALHTALVQ